MAASRGRKQKPSTEILPPVTVRLSEIPYFAFVPDDPKLKGRTYVGPTRNHAIANATADVNLFYKGRAESVTVEVDE